LAEVATGAQSYASYASTYAGRLNLVYVGANDGLLHAFRAGSYDAAGHYINNATTPNDGREMLAYMPSTIVNTIHNGISAGLDFSSPQYGHNYFVDAAPGTGDLFFKNAWHTWLIGGLGPGGSAIYALDITDPSTFSESNASSIVIGEWDNTTLTNLGQTYGTPVITRFHNGQWGAVFGNGLNSANGVAGIYIMLVDPTSGAISFKFLTTGPGSSSNPNGIAFATPADLDYDNITDYVYAGDMYGQVWRFDLTSSNPSNWGVKTSSGTVATSTNAGVPMFKTNSGQPISTKVMVAAVAPSSATALSRIMVMFGTGTKVPQSLTSPAIYATGTQDIYDVWDWNMTTWNSLSTTDYAALGGANAPTAVLGKTNLAQQSIIQTFNFTDQNATQPSRTITSNAVCWQGSTVCAGGATVNNKFGSYLDLPSTTTAGGTTVYEQAIYSPAILAGAFVINTAVPETNSPFTCTASSAQSWTYGLSVANGGATSVSYFGLSANGTPVSAISFNGVGTSSLVNGDILITQTSIGGGGSGTGGGSPGSGSGSGTGSGSGSGGGSGLNVQKVTPVPGTGARINWAQLR
jgi:type IV pilus assembly protein PilY1